MIEYSEQAQMVDALRYCRDTDSPCRLCPGRGEPLHCRNGGWVMGNAADMIEAQYRQIEELRQEIAEQDEEIAGLKREIMSYPAEEIEREERCEL